MGDKKKKIIKYTLISSCIVLVIVATVVLQALNSSPVFAKSIISTSSTITRDLNDDELNIYDYVQIFPHNYNQGLECKSSSENVEVKNGGEIKFLQDEYFVTITVFAKSNQSDLIYTSFDVVLNEYHAPTIEKKLIKIDEADIDLTYNNKLNYADNSKISVSSLYNLAKYDYVTGNLTINENESQSHLYDKVTVEIISQGVKTTLNFEICIVKELEFNYENKSCEINFKNTITKSDESVGVRIANENCIVYLSRGATCVVFKIISKGSSEVEIYSSQSTFRYFYKITIV